MLSTTDTGAHQQDVVAGEGELRCTTCGYAVAVASQPDKCPMCQGTEWDAVPWRPFTREHALAGADEPSESRPVAKVA